MRSRHPSVKPRGPEALCMHGIGRQRAGSLPCPSPLAESQVSRHMSQPPIGKMEPKKKLLENKKWLMIPFPDTKIVHLQVSPIS